MGSNTWPNGRRAAITQDAHERWNAKHCPGTRQLCIVCDEQTGRCEEDALYLDMFGPLCKECHKKLEQEDATGAALEAQSDRERDDRLTGYWR